MATTATQDKDKATGQDDRETIGDSTEVAVKKMIAKAKERGYISYDELNAALPTEEMSSEKIEDVMTMLSEMGINVIDGDEAEEPEPEKEEEKEEFKATEKKDGVGDRTDDPVRMYLREMGSVELLSREGEIAIAKRIEAGRATMITGLCMSPLTFKAITEWAERLSNEEMLLRDIIDLEATLGKQPSANELEDENAGDVMAEAEGKPEKDEPEEAETPAAEGENAEGGEAAEGAEGTEGEAKKSDDDDYDDDIGMSLSAMEAHLTPETIEKFQTITSTYKKYAKLQDARMAAAVQGEGLSTAQERRFKKLGDELIALISSVKFNNLRIE
ncbi:MAG: RNA polymerase sigma factor region1.1 domain-containing protein [Kordiimonas sp.]